MVWAQRQLCRGGGSRAAEGTEGRMPDSSHRGCRCQHRLHICCAYWDVPSVPSLQKEQRNKIKSSCFSLHQFRWKWWPHSNSSDIAAHVLTFASLVHTDIVHEGTLLDEHYTYVESLRHFALHTLFQTWKIKEEIRPGFWPLADISFIPSPLNYVFTLQIFLEVHYGSALSEMWYIK